mmetsp:Transcript_56157/g.132316  ORF Transcript_56157/g.132316 Transcript_56157/m.132316 type:complete len:324 (-) Transcript_56157:373-1344(-)
MVLALSPAFAPSLQASRTMLQPAWLGSPRNAASPLLLGGGIDHRSKLRAQERGYMLGLKMSSTDTLTTTESKGAENSKMTVITPDFRLSLSVVCLGLYLLKSQVTGFGMLFSFVGAFLVLQTIRLRFRFSENSLDVLRVDELSDDGKQISPSSSSSADPAGRKVAIGPWKYSSVTNWEFWWPGFPLIAYFKETQTKKTGQRHFFFMIMDGKAVYGEMLKRFGNPMNAKPALEEWNDLRPLSPKGYTRFKSMLRRKLKNLEEQLQIKRRIATALSWVKQVRAEDISVTFKKLAALVRGYALKAVRSAKELVQKGTGSGAKKQQP